MRLMEQPLTCRARLEHMYHLGYIYRVRKLERPLPLRLYLYFLKWKGTAAICTFYLKKGAIPYSQIPPVPALGL